VFEFLIGIAILALIVIGLTAPSRARAAREQQHRQHAELMCALATARLSTKSIPTAGRRTTRHA
jgi:hypothetical protein